MTDKKFTDSEINDIIQNTDYNKNGFIDFKEFVNIVLYK